MSIRSVSVARPSPSSTTPCCHSLPRTTLLLVPASQGGARNEMPPTRLRNRPVRARAKIPPAMLSKLRSTVPRLLLRSRVSTNVSRSPMSRHRTRLAPALSLQAASCRPFPTSTLCWMYLDLNMCMQGLPMWLAPLLQVPAILRRHQSFRTKGLPWIHTDSRPMWGHRTPSISEAPRRSLLTNPRPRNFNSFSVQTQIMTGFSLIRPRKTSR